MSYFFESSAATLGKAFTVNGAASRREYWSFVAFTWLATIAALVIDHFIGGEVVYNIVNILLFVPALTVAIRRMHDTNHRGWWLLVPIVNLILLITPTQVNRWSQVNN